MYKRGQFFLIAAVITVSALFGLTAVINSVETGTSNAPFYERVDPLSYETKRVIDHGTYYAKDSQLLVEKFLKDYSEYIKQDKVLFIFGNADTLNALYFQDSSIGSTGIDTGGSSKLITIQQVTQATAQVYTENGVVNVVIGDVTYRFKLLEGQNFFFVIQKGAGNDILVKTN